MILNSAKDESPQQTSRVASYCCVVIPCYNEAARLPVSEYERHLKSVKDQGVFLLFVNDGSDDTTLDRLTMLRERYPEQVDVLNLKSNRGKAEAVRQGMLKAIALGRTQVTGYWDADLATPLAQIQDMLHLLDQNPELDLVLGSRVRLLGRDIQRNAIRHYLGRCFATVVSQLLHLPIYDSQCGAKLFRVNPDLSNILAYPFRSRWVFDVEILTRYLELYNGNVEMMKAKTYEYPLPKWIDVAGSKVRPLDFLRSFAEVAEIYRQYRTKLRRSYLRASSTAPTM